MNEKSYWNHRGPHQLMYEELREALVPRPGAGETSHGELLRAMSSVYYDVHNDGGCNQGMRDLALDRGTLSAGMHHVVVIQPDLAMVLASLRTIGDWHEGRNDLDEGQIEPMLAALEEPLERVLDAVVLEVYRRWSNYGEFGDDRESTHHASSPGEDQ